MRAPGPTRQRILGDLGAQRVPAADRVGGAAGGGCRATARAQSGLCGTAADGRGAAQEAGEEKEAGCNGEPPRRDIARSLGRASPGSSARLGRSRSGPGCERRTGGIRDQLSLAIEVASGCSFSDGACAAAPRALDALAYIRQNSHMSSGKTAIPSPVARGGSDRI